MRTFGSRITQGMRSLATCQVTEFSISSCRLQSSGNQAEQIAPSGTSIYRRSFMFRFSQSVS